jgi:hypothetical protein
MALLKLLKLFGSGGSGLTPNKSAGTPDLRSILAALIKAAGLDQTATPDTTWWTTGVAVAGDTATLATAGRVLAVDATTATAAGGKTLQLQGTPAAGTVQVTYDSAGIPTLTFNGTDAVTVAAVMQLGYGGDEFEVEA